MPAPPARDAPRVSVCVPAWRSDRTVGAFLAALERQTFGDFECLLVNSSPGDRTAALCAPYDRVTCIESTSRLLPHAARNRAVERARGSILVFTDPDVEPRPDWLEQLVGAVDRGEEVVAGVMDVRRGLGVHLVKFWWLLAGASAGHVPIAPTANAAYTRAAFDRAGPFDGDVMAADALLSWRAGGASIVSGAVVAHVHDESLRDLVRQRRSRGEEFARVRAAHLGWSRRRRVVHAALLPALVVVVVGRAGAAARRAGWGARWMRTLHWQLAGHAAWNLGEAKGLLGRPA